MTVAIVTSSPSGFACMLLARFPISGVTLTAVILNKARRRPITKILAKIAVVGVPGVAVGWFSRRWYRMHFGNLYGLANELSIPLFVTNNFQLDGNCGTIVAQTDIGISMGNGFIPTHFFSRFKIGMINIHHEILPDFPGAQAVVWPLIANQIHTGFSIHYISSKIDRGDLIHVEKRQIQFKDTFAQTVRVNYVTSVELSIIGLIKLLKKPIATWPRLRNTTSHYFTTPSFRHWWRGWRNFNNLKRQI